MCIDEIEDIRAENNKNWMDILRIALKYAPDETRVILKDIVDSDRKITEIMNEL